jgi:hypothetical protein
MNSDDISKHPGWNDCTFDGARRQILLLGMKTSLREKILWLEQMQELGEKLKEAAVRRDMGMAKQGRGSND